jgi:phosphomannomutase
MTTQLKISFGTDGVRGVMADDFTFDTVRTLARATALYLQKEGFRGARVPVGYDSRLLSREFAREAASVFANLGFDAILASRIVPTPVLSAAVKLLKAPIGVMITASHNPAIYNGFKLKGPWGGPVDRKTHEGVLEALKESTDGAKTGGSVLGKTDVKARERKGAKIREMDFFEIYVPFISKFVDLGFLRKTRMTFVADSMHGAALDYLISILGRDLVIPLRFEPNPSFEGLKPEPVEENLDKLKARVKETHASLGVANDGDSDRLGAVDENGRYVSSHHLFLLFALHLASRVPSASKISRAARGSASLTSPAPVGKRRIVKTVSLSSKIDLLASEPERFTLFSRPGKPAGRFSSLESPFEVVATKVGFSHVSEAMRASDSLIGGEESGGFALSGDFPERDGLLAALTLSEIVASAEKPLSEIIHDLEEMTGPIDASRIDIDTVNGSEFVQDLKSSPPREFAGQRLTGISTMDNIKLFMDDAWILFRASNTEPVLRLYAEGGKKISASKILEFAKKVAS